MENSNFQKGGVGTAFKTISIILLIAITGLVGYLAYNSFTSGNSGSKDTYFSASEFEKVPTVEEAMAIRANVLESWRCESVYAEIPPMIMQMLFEELGTQEAIKTYVYEYEANEEAYINAYLSQKAQLKIDKNTASKIQSVEIKTKLRDPEPTDQNVPITAVPDTVIQ